MIKLRPHQEQWRAAALDGAVITIRQDPNRFVADLADGVKLDCSFLEICAPSPPTRANRPSLHTPV